MFLSNQESRGFKNQVTYFTGEMSSGRPKTVLSEPVQPKKLSLLDLPNRVNPEIVKPLPPVDYTNTLQPGKILGSTGNLNELLNPDFNQLNMQVPIGEIVNNVVGKESSKQIPEAKIENTQTLDQLSEAFLAEVDNIDLGKTETIIQNQVVEQLQKQMSELQTSPELNAKIQEVAQQEIGKNAKKGLGFLKKFGETAKKVWNLLDKPVSAKQMAGMVLLAGGVTIATLAALPVAAALAGGTIAGTAASYGAIGLAAGIPGLSVFGLAVAPIAASTVAVLSAVGAAQGITLLRDKPKQQTVINQNQPSEIQTQQLSQIPENSVKIPVMEVNTPQLDEIKPQTESPVPDNLEVVKNQNIEQIPVLSAQETTHPLVENQESPDIKNLVKVEQSLDSYEAAFENVKSKITALDKAINVLKLEEIDIKDLEQQKSEILDIVKNEQDQVTQNLPPIITNLQDAKNTDSSGYTEIQSRYSKLADKLDKYGFSYTGVHESGDALLVTNSSPKVETIKTLPTEEQITDVPEIKPAIENVVESGNIKTKELIENFSFVDQAVKSVNNEQLESDVDSLIQELDNLGGDKKVKAILGLDETDNTTKVKDLVKASLMFANINEFGENNSNLQFIQNTALSLDDGILQNPNLSELKDYRGPSYDNIHRLVENFSMAKTYLGLKEVNSKIDKFKGDGKLDLDRDTSLKLTINILEKQPAAIVGALIEVLVKNNPDLKGIINLENIQGLYDAEDMNNLDAKQRKALVEIPKLLNEIFSDREITKTEANNVISEIKPSVVAK